GTSEFPTHHERQRRSDSAWRQPFRRLPGGQSRPDPDHYIRPRAACAHLPAAGDAGRSARGAMLMRGSVRKRGSTWTWYLFVPDPMTGERRQRSKGGFRTKRDCQEALNEALARLREGTFVRP